MGIAVYKLKKSLAVQPNYQGAFQGSYVNLNDITFVLSQMPPDTSIAFIKASPITGLYMESEIGLYNGIFKDDVELVDNSNYMRDIGFTKSGEMIQYNRNTDFNLKEVVRQHDEIEESEDE